MARIPGIDSAFALLAAQAEALERLPEVELVGATLRGVAAGQSLVAYLGTRVLGQSTVVASSRAGRAETQPAQPTQPATQPARSA